MNSAQRKLSLQPRKLLRSASVLLALLFVLLRPACEVFAASGDRHAPAVSGHSAVQTVGDHQGGGHSDDEICCASVDAQALTVPATAPLPATPSQALAAPSSAVLPKWVPNAPATNVVARRAPAPPLPYHARSLRRLD